jgi:hypothetical protein
MAKKESRLEHGHRWGRWRLALTDPPSLDFVGAPYRESYPYEIVLSRLLNQTDYHTWPGLVDWIQHLAEKDWGVENMGDFVIAVLDIKLLGIGKTIQGDDE